MSKQGNIFSNIKKKVGHIFLTAILFCLPESMVLIFLELSISSLFIKSKGFDKVNMDKFFSVVHNKNYGKDANNLPNFVFDSIWTESFLTKPINFNGEFWSVIEVLNNRDLFYKNRREVIDLVLNELPNEIKTKLGLFMKSRCREIRESVLVHIDAKGLI